MKTIVKFAFAFAVVAGLGGIASADTDAFSSQIFPGSPQSNRPGFPPTLTTNPDGRGRITWGSGSYPALTLGLEFMVTEPQGITIWELGVWDDLVVLSLDPYITDHVLLSPHTIGLYDLDTQALLVEIDTAPGGGVLRDGYRYFDTPNIVLEVGSRFVVAVHYYGGNLDSSGNSGREDQNFEPRPVFNDGGGAITNVGIGRYGLVPGFPAFADTGPSNRYHSGSFSFTPNPEPGTFFLLGGALAVAGMVRRRRRNRSA